MRKSIFFVLWQVAAVAGWAQVKFPQQELNRATAGVLANYPKKQVQPGKRQTAAPAPASVAGVLSKIQELRKNSTQKLMSTAWVQLGDTIVVGATPNDTLKITGSWTHSGPILVLGNGVLLIKNATLVDTGDVYVFQNGKLIADSSSLTFPQQYFYQRSLIAVQNGTVQMQNCSLNYSGMQHNLVLGDSAHVTFRNIHQNDWTTCGLYSRPTLLIDGCNLAGEYILMDSCQATFKNTDTLLLWHHFPAGASVNYAFPNGAAVNTYSFNNTVSGVSGIKYNVQADTCHTVWWAMMPENGTNISIANSDIRVIGAWFKNADTVSVSGLYDNSSYTNFTAPLADRNLQLTNSNVVTWNLYVFDKSHIDLANCQVGEVGTEQKATVMQTAPFTLDGTGGYYWATDTSAIISVGATVNSYARSERNGIFIFAYGIEPYTAPQAIGQSLMVCVQCYTPADPQYFDAAMAWMDKIDGPDTSYTNTTFPIIGSAWIDWAGGGTGWMNFASYSVYYQLQGGTGWTNVVKDSLVELHHVPVANWNTAGLAAGNYNVKLTVKNSLGDSVEAIMPITLLAGVNSIASAHKPEPQLYPNPAKGSFTLKLNDPEGGVLEIYNMAGEKLLTRILHDASTFVDMERLSSGIYLARVLKNNQQVFLKKIVKE